MANKVWNVCRFLQMKRDELGDEAGEGAQLELSTADRWILSRYHTAVKSATESLEKYRITEYAKTLHDFVWRDFCDWYVEIVKVQFAANEDPAYRKALLDHAFSIIDGTLVLLHPVMPFLTEELWHGLFGASEDQSIMHRPAPTATTDLIDSTVEEQFAILQSVVEGLRRQRAEMEIPPSKKLPVHMSADETMAAFLEEQRDVFNSFARCSELVIGTGLDKPSGSVGDVIRGIETFLVVDGEIDLDKERQRLTKEVERLTKSIAGVERKLSNEGFLKGAKPEVVASEKQKLADWSASKEKIERNLATL